ncbi:MAG TPA: glutamine-hydrolyzing carbamoyl-phosphate synthase small subunit [Firmicutes bacterium]|nr:glutamine-hydrolyzing carbamoyl-phosphate synthase small subunit [Bacillota bacterium]
MQGRLVLEDGTTFLGISRGAEGEAQGEVVFNTSMTGYQEIISDPSYCGQILAMTFPLIGNYGINPEDFESRRPFLRGVIAREFCLTPSNWRSVMTVGDYLKENNIVALDNIDTRALTRHIRIKGCMRGVITTKDTPREILLEKLQKAPHISEIDLISEVTTPEIYTLENNGPHIVIMDLGLKLSIARSLHNTGCRITVVPASLNAQDIMELKPAGLVLSSGPGDPQMAKNAINTANELAGKLPLLGIGLGHQVIALALGGKTYKLKFGHRGANHPVKDILRDKVYITSQNHGFAVDEESLPVGISVTRRNLNDGTVEGLMHENLRIITIQYHPEAYPGLPETFPESTDSQYPFNHFLELLKPV